jgi:hypothetical protein
VYVPDLPQETYQNLLDALAQEFTYTFGGSTIMRGPMGDTSPVMACRFRTASTSSTPIRHSCLRNMLRGSPDTLMSSGTPCLRRWKKKLFWSLSSRFIMLSDWVIAVSVVP